MKSTLLCSSPASSITVSSRSSASCFNRLIPGFGNHELFHVFVMLGSICHYITMYSL